jgi:hypothetical protein
LHHQVDPTTATPKKSSIRWVSQYLCQRGQAGFAAVDTDFLHDPHCHVPSPMSGCSRRNIQKLLVILIFFHEQHVGYQTTPTPLSIFFFFGSVGIFDTKKSKTWVDRVSIEYKPSWWPVVI